MACGIFYDPDFAGVGYQCNSRPSICPKKYESCMITPVLFSDSYVA